MAQGETSVMDRTNQVIATLSGLVLLAAALGIAMMVTWIIVRQLVIGAGIARTALLFSAALALVACVCGTLGFRLRSIGQIVINRFFRRLAGTQWPLCLSCWGPALALC